MKTSSIFLISVTCLTLISFTIKSDKPSGKSVINYSYTDILAVSQLKLDANNISAWFRNNGNFNNDPVTGSAGFEWPKGSGNTARYSSGLWMGCISNGDTLTAIAEYALMITYRDMLIMPGSRRVYLIRYTESTVS
ncbi:MAG: hypothetical protein IPM38_07285 [Ignavibacteria bacterium]|nr:hypothetical protein [Ignavibacteria bacterium]